MTTKTAPAVTTRFVDFWLLGGASIVLWAVMGLGQLARGHSSVIDSHMFQAWAFFNLMSIFCNHPHFMISYRFGYGRGVGFIRRHWFSLIAVPLGLIALYSVAYFDFGSTLSERPWAVLVNAGLERIGVGYRVGSFANVGIELLSLSVLLMNATVGWHYAKQVFGCMMVYAKYDHYSLSRLQRRLIKTNLFSLALFNFISMSVFTVENNPFGQGYFQGIPMLPLGIPRAAIAIAAVILAVSAISVVVGVVHANRAKHGRLPSLNFLIPWVAFHVWWIPIYAMKEYYFMAIPFFHGLQYLPFAYRIENGRIPREGMRQDLERTLKLAALLVIGFCAFEYVPSVLDEYFETSWHQVASFFTIAFAVFINVHHFFIDSCVWKLDQPQVRKQLLDAG